MLVFARASKRFMLAVNFDQLYDLVTLLVIKIMMHSKLSYLQSCS
jgi:hypothetical protein